MYDLAFELWIAYEHDAENPTPPLRPQRILPNWSPNGGTRNGTIDENNLEISRKKTPIHNLDIR